MHFPDQSHINRVRDALWQSSRKAAVMVGAGFSRNAVPKHTGLPTAPTWPELAQAIHAKLNSNADGQQEGLEPEAASQSSSILRVAQEYQSAFGRTDLHSLLQLLIRDDQFLPGSAHERLLELPWRDVFTTNWDTLLERASSSVPNRYYSFVRSADEIPLAASPRIVKLHGSIDPLTPLIVTEEDYRTYPFRFAPFVNTVQQSMMETILLLIGFSGEDPNFLYWSGWVRDNLGDSAPKIYLAGWLGLSMHRRRMLEDRNIVPIDLARHPAADQWQQHSTWVCHERATEWILRTLEYGRPYVPANWPLPMDLQDDPIPDHLVPIERIVINAPQSEPDMQSTSGEEQSEEGKRQAVQDLLNVWKHNRKNTYPGWLSAPSVVREAMGSPIEKATPILDALPLLDTENCLRALFELIWRWGIQLQPISLLEPTSAKLESAAADVLSRIDGQNKAIDGEPADDANWKSIARAWVAVDLALVRAARFRFDFEEFDKRLSALVPFLDGRVDIRHDVSHERCLWAIYELDYKSLEEQLANWKVEGGDPVWMMRKAALLFELGRDEEAQALNSSALNAIRRIPADDTRVDAPSRESWALYCAGATLGFQDYWSASLEWRQRWDELTPLKCNALLEMHFGAEAIRGKDKPDKGAHFDLGVEWRPGYSFSIAEYLRWAASHRALRLTEVAGLPPRIGDRVVASSNLLLAARELCPLEPELAARIVMRTADNYESTGTLNFVLSRARIAGLSKEAASRLAQIAVRAIEYAVLLSSNANASGRQHWLRRLRGCTESLSRIVLRLEVDQIDKILSKALAWYENELIATSVGMAGPMYNLLKRTWDSLPDERRLARICDIFETRIVGLDGFAVEQEHVDKQYPDPCVVLKKRSKGQRVENNDDDSRWAGIINFIVRGLELGGEARTRAAVRVGHLVDVKPLDSDEQSRISYALWGNDYAEHEDLPTKLDSIYEWAFLVLPQPEAGIAESRFRAKWLNKERLSEAVPSESRQVLWQVGTALGNLKTHSYPFPLSNKDRSVLRNAIQEWAKEPAPVPLPRFARGSTPVFVGGADEDARKVITGLQYLLLEVDISETVAEDLFRKARRLNDTGMMHARLTYPGLVRVAPELRADIVEELRFALVSDDKETVRNAVQALEFWLIAEKEMRSEIAEPPIELLREVGVMIATRRKAALINALRLAAWVFREGTSEQREVIEGLAIDGLASLSRKLSYKNEHEEEIDLPLLRWGCASLAVAMFRHGLTDNATVLRWIKEAKSDPLPEVRFCVNGDNASPS